MLNIKLAFNLNVERHLKDYYQSQHISVEQEIIDKGIETYFADSLSYRQDDLSFMQGVLFTLFVKRKQLFVSMLVLCLFCIAIFGFTKYNDEQIAKQYALVKDTYAILATLTEEYKALETSCDTMHYMNIACKNSFNHNKKYIISAENLGNNLTANTKIELIDNLKRAVQHAKLIIISYEETEDQVSKVVDSEKFQQLRDTFPAIELAYANFIDALQSESININEQLKYLNVDIQAASKMLDKKKSLDNYKVQFDGFMMTEKDHLLIYSLIEGTERNIYEMKENDVNNNLAALDYYLKLIKVYLDLVIVDRVGEYSGVIRTNDDTGADSYYLIVEPVENSGEVYTLFIKNSETDRTEYVKIFGVQVPYKVFSKIRDEKKSGRIDNPKIAHKPVGSISFIYSVYVNEAYITRW